MKTTYVEPSVRCMDFSHLKYRLGRLCIEDMEGLGLTECENRHIESSIDKSSPRGIA